MEDENEYSKSEEAANAAREAARKQAEERAAARLQLQSDINAEREATAAVRLHLSSLSCAL